MGPSARIHETDFFSIAVGVSPGIPKIAIQRTENGGLHLSWLDLRFGRPKFYPKIAQSLEKNGLGPPIGVPQKRRPPDQPATADLLGLFGLATGALQKNPKLIFGGSCWSGSCWSAANGGLRDGKDKRIQGYLREKGLSSFVFSQFPRCSPCPQEKGEKGGQKARKGPISGKEARHLSSPICYTPICGSPILALWGQKAQKESESTTQPSKELPT